MSFYNTLPPPSSTLLTPVRSSPTAPALKPTIVVKYGGNAMTSPRLSTLFAADCAYLSSLGVSVVVVHGGGPTITKLLGDLGVPSTFCDKTGVRISTDRVVRAAELALSGRVNKDLAAAIHDASEVLFPDTPSSSLSSSSSNSNSVSSSSVKPATAVGISGREGGLLQCVPLLGPNGENLGNVGQPVAVNPAIINSLLASPSPIVPVISPIGGPSPSSPSSSSSSSERSLRGVEVDVYNVNADTAAGVLARRLGAHAVLFLTDIRGVLDGERKLIKTLDGGRNKGRTAVEDLIEDGVITGGMIPKVRYATLALEVGKTEGEGPGAKMAVIADGRVEHILAKMVLGGGLEGKMEVGTVIRRR